MAAFSLKANDTVATETASGDAMACLAIGANWGKINKFGEGKFGKLAGKLLGGAAKEDVDLDLSIICLDDKHNYLAKESVHFDNPNNPNKSIMHTGDDRGGDDEDDGADNEVINVFLPKVPAGTKYMYPVLNNYTEQPFSSVPYIKVRLYDVERGLTTDKSASHFAEWDVSKDKTFGNVNAMIIAKAVRREDGSGIFDVTALGQPSSATSIRMLADEVKKMA